MEIKIILSRYSRSFFSLISVPIGLYVFLPQIGEGLWSLSWQESEGQWLEEENSYSFSVINFDGSKSEYTGRRIYVGRGSRNQGEIDRLFEDAIDQSVWRGRNLIVHVHPLHPDKSVLKAGVPPQITLLFLLYMGVLAPTTIFWFQWLRRGKNRQWTRESMVLGLGAGFFYLLFSLPAMGMVWFVAHYLRIVPPVWPVWLFVAVSFPLWLRPDIALRLYGLTRVRRLLYLVLLGCVLPPVVLGIGLGFPLMLGLTLVLLLIVLLFFPFARPRTITLLGLLVAFVWLPVYLSGLLDPCRAVILFLYSLLPYFPYYIQCNHLADPHNIALLDTVIAGSGIIVTLVLTALDSVWRYAQIKQVENLPTSKARSAAVGIAEFSGTARKCNSDESTDSDLIIGYETMRAVHLEPFFLEDDTGKILVDPRGIKIRTGLAGSFGGRICEAVLSGRVEPATIDRPHRVQLLEGDPVYLVGNV